MDKNAIKKYAVWARNELLEKVSQKALQYGIEEGKELDSKLDSINGVLLTEVEKKQRQALIRKIEDDGFSQVMEEVAYTWFNRFIALRFMEVNGYLPSHVRVFSDENNAFKPQILSEALHLEFDGLDPEVVMEMKQSNQDEELFKYLLIVQCNELNKVLPRMFQKISDYTELLLPDYLLRDGSVIERLVNPEGGIKEEDWLDQVQIIGWLYQYYNTEPKASVDAKVKKGIKVTKQELPAKTQIFTPDWVVKYMSDNSLGRLWLEGHPDSKLKEDLRYYVDCNKQEIDVKQKLDEKRNVYEGIDPKEIKCLDPCMGSGHILCVLFDTLLAIYEDYGYTAREAVESIVKNNIWGLDVDERASQLAYFAIMMKARKYDRRFFSTGIQPNVFVIEESNGLGYSGSFNDFSLNEDQSNLLKKLLELFRDAKEYGSILEVNNDSYDDLLKAWNEAEDISKNNIGTYSWYLYAGDKIKNLIMQAIVISQKYDVVITNPPYMGNSDMNAKLASLVQGKYSIAKSDLYSTFMLRCEKYLKPSGFEAMVTMQSWMNLGAFDELRKTICTQQDIISLWHLDDTLLGIAYQTSAFILKKTHVNNFRGIYYFASKEQYNSFGEDMYQALDKPYYAEQDAFTELTGCPIAYSLGEKCIDAYVKSEEMSSVLVTREGMTTGSNDLFLRLWHEIDINKMNSKWFPYNKDGEYRKWYGNDEYLVNWENDGAAIRSFKDEKTGRVRSHNYNGEYAFREGITWSAFSSRGATFRYSDSQFLFDSKGSKGFCSKELVPYILAFLNSSVGEKYLSYFAGAKDKKPGHIVALPYRYSEKYFESIVELARRCIEIEKEEWDSHETSWNFSENILIKNNTDGNISTAVANSIDYWKSRFAEIKSAEEKINSMFIDVFNVEEEVCSKVSDTDITVRIPDKKDLVQEFISYAVGCMFGRFSLDNAGLAYAGGKWEESLYRTFKPDEDAIIPICDDEYFADDIVGRFVAFTEEVFGKEHLEENLQFISSELKGKESPREIIRNYFLNDFYGYHTKMYQKMPIYWLVDSGKKNGFKCLVYMHRYKTETIARIRTDYVHELQARYRTAIEETQNRIESSSGSDRVKLSKKLELLKQQDEEIHTFEEKIHHLADKMISIDLDDGVKTNYAKFQDILANIK